MHSAKRNENATALHASGSAAVAVAVADADAVAVQEGGTWLPAVLDEQQIKQRMFKAARVSH